MTLPPGPVGPQHARLNAQFFQRDPLGFLSHLADSFGDVSRFDFGAGPIVFVHDADLVRSLFRFHEADLIKPEFLRASNAAHWGDGLTTLDDPGIWHSRRQLLLPLFRARLRAPRLALAAELADETCARWADGEQIDLTHELRILTARIALRTVLDADLEDFCDDQKLSGLVPFSEGYGEDFTTAIDGATGVMQMTRPRASRRMDGVLSIIHARFDDPSDRGDVLSALVNAHRADPEALSVQDVIGEIIQMLFAGHLTIPFALTQLWRDIAQHGLDSQVTGEATADDGLLRREMTIPVTSRTMAILRESMRLGPPAPILYRDVARGFQLGKHSMVEGHGIWVSPGLLHRDSRYFVQPAAFRPERFATGRLPPVSAKAYMPFGAGPRVCIAASQSVSQMVAICHAIARKFRLEPVSGVGNQFEVWRRPVI